MKHIYTRQTLGREKAVALFDSKWWEGKRAHDIAAFQLFTEELCLPFDVFHEALEKALVRPVFTHELGLNYDGIVSELFGEKGPPTLKEIVELIPEDKRLIMSPKDFQ